MYGGDVYREFWWENLRKISHSEDPGIDGTIILRWIFRKWDWGGMNRVDPAQDMERWQALVNVVMNL
jgi:hypothetical protein